MPTISPVQYELKEWTPYLADSLISYLQQYPETFPDYERGYHESGYYASFYYAALIQKESLLRFPTIQQDFTWRWGLAYNLAQTGYDQLGISASEIYSELITKALNSKEVEISNLSQWFLEREPRLELRVVELPVPQHLVLSKLLEISAGQWSGAYLWLVGNGISYEIYPLKNNADFGFSSESGISYLLSDLTGDGIPEITIVHEHAHGVGSLFNDFQTGIFDISSTPPKLLSLVPPAPDFGYISLSVRKDISEGTNLVIDRHIWYECPGAITYNYHWSKNILQLSDFKFPITIDFFQYPGCVSESWYLLIDAADAGYPNSRELLLEWLDALPKTIENSGLYIDNWFDYRDELRYRVGILVASWGEIDIARQIMGILKNNPSYTESKWINQAQEFLSVVRQSVDMANACAGSIICYPYLNLQTLAQYSRTASTGDPLKYLRLAGVKITAGGLLGLDGDDALEYWFVVTNSEGNNNFYLLVDSLGGFYVNSLRTIPTNLAEADDFSFSQHPSFDGKPYYQIRYHGQETNFIFYRVSAPEGFVLTNTEDHIVDTISNSERELLSGTDPIHVKNRLLSLQYPGLFPCIGDSYQCWISSKYLYLLGLAYELSGNETQAVETYLSLWRNYPQSEYAYIAYSKLEPAP